MCLGFRGIIVHLHAESEAQLLSDGTRAACYRARTPIEGDILILLICVGDAYWKCRTNPADLSDDPVETAARLVALIKDKMKTDNDPANYL